MRIELLWNPRLLCERLAVASQRKRRFAKLSGTPAGTLKLGHIDSLELLEILRPIKINSIYDIGANVGTWTLLAKSIFPDASLEAFEPLPSHHLDFHRAVEGLSGVTLHAVALGAENTSEILRVTDFSDATSVLPLSDAGRVQFGLTEARQHPIQLHKLDEYRADHRLGAPDLVKLDVQGYELQVIRGATDCLNAAKAIICEVSFIEFYTGQCFFHEIVTALAEFGLFPRAFSVSTTLGNSLEQTDVLFTKRWW